MKDCYHYSIICSTVLLLCSMQHCHCWTSFWRLVEQKNIKYSVEFYHVPIMFVQQLLIAPLRLIYIEKGIHRGTLQQIKLQKSFLRWKKIKWLTLFIGLDFEWIWGSLNVSINLVHILKQNDNFLDCINCKMKAWTYDRINQILNNIEICLKITTIIDCCKPNFTGATKTLEWHVAII